VGDCLRFKDSLRCRVIIENSDHLEVLLVDRFHHLTVTPVACEDVLTCLHALLCGQLLRNVPCATNPHSVISTNNLKNQYIKELYRLHKIRCGFFHPAYYFFFSDKSHVFFHLNDSLEQKY
jgi:hypothetical protein